MVGGTGSTGALLASAETYDPATNTWSAAGSHCAAQSHTATLLPNGKVLVAGGGAGAAHTRQRRTVRPGHQHLVAAGNMITARERHTATLLPNGKVLVAGGTDSGCVTAPNSTTRPQTPGRRQETSLLNAHTIPLRYYLTVACWWREGGCRLTAAPKSTT